MSTKRSGVKKVTKRSSKNIKLSTYSDILDFILTKIFVDYIKMVAINLNIIQKQQKDTIIAKLSKHFLTFSCKTDTKEGHAKK